MGIQYILRSTNTLYEDQSMYYCKYAWRDIDWQLIFEILGINLGVLCDNYISYWSPEQIKDIRNGIQCLKENPKVYLFNDYSESNNYSKEDKEYLLNNSSEIQEKIKKYKTEQIEFLLQDVNKLLEFFNYYVENNVYIDIM